MNSTRPLACSHNRLNSRARLTRLRSTLPSNVIPLFQEFGRTLRSDEYIIVSAKATRTGARYDKVKTQILSWASTPYDDRVDLIGEVRGTDLDGLRFTLHLLDGRKIPGRFQTEENTILEALGGDCE